jgi:hypothetical protein
MVSCVGRIGSERYIDSTTKVPIHGCDHRGEIRQQKCEGRASHVAKDHSKRNEQFHFLLSMRNSICAINDIK